MYTDMPILNSPVSAREAAGAPTSSEHPADCAADAAIREPKRTDNNFTERRETGGNISTVYASAFPHSY
jgi:hypothetical protein